MNKENLNYFSAKEKNFFHNFKQFRDSLFHPICKLLMKIGIKPDYITYFGFLLLIGFCYFVILNPILASVFLLFHVLLDAFDGSLARLMKTDGDHGAVADIFFDHSGMAVVTITLMHIGFIMPLIGALYLYLYTIMIIFVVIRNRIGKPIKVVFRTKYYLYILYGVFAFWGLNYLDYGLLIFTALMIPSIVASYIVIRKSLITSF